MAIPQHHLTVTSARFFSSLGLVGQENCNICSHRCQQDFLNLSKYSNLQKAMRRVYHIVCERLHLELNITYK